MSFEFELGRDVDLGGGYRLVTPGYRGTGTATEPHDYEEGATRSATSAATLTDELAGAMDRAGMREEQAIELTLVPEPSEQPSRSAAYGDAVILEVPDLGADRGQLVMLTDEDGAISFHYPVGSTDDQAVQGPSVRGVGNTKTFIIPAHVPDPSEAAPAETRSLASTIGRKLLQVLTFPMVRTVGRLVGEPLVRWWESEHRPYGVRWFGPDHYRSCTESFTTDDWERLDGQRSLLFIHGTFSTAAGGFGGMPRAVMEKLSDRYDGRVFALEHPSLSATPVDNVAWFLEQVPAGVTLDLDVVAHSRGGLVARILAGGAHDGSLDLAHVSVRSIVCAGTPNYGTPLADPDHLSAFCDRLATAANLVPGFPVGDIVDAVMLVVQYIAQGVLQGLRGLEVMNPHSDFLIRLNDAPPDHVALHGIAADYEPKQQGMKRILAGAKNVGVDAVFEGAENDLVVPTIGVFSGAAPFRIAESQVVRFASDRGVMHSTFWKEPEVAESFDDWLVG